MGGLPLSRREAKGPSSTRGGGPVLLSPAPLGRGRDARRGCHGRWFSAGRYVDNIMCGEERANIFFLPASAALFSDP